MNYYDARAIADTEDARRLGTVGKWHYTSANRRTGTHAVGYCSDWNDCPDCEAPRGFGDKDCKTCDGKGIVRKTDEELSSHAHDTPEEARACFRRYLLDGSDEESYADWSGCEAEVDGEKCDVPTKKGLTTRQPLGHGYPLCDEHRTKGQLERLAPGVGTITASY